MITETTQGEQTPESKPNHTESTSQYAGYDGTPPPAEPKKPLENRNWEYKDHEFKFHGSYKAFLGLSLYNLLLTVLTLGIYYPWAKCAIRKFMWQETEVAGSRFEWHGTGKEMFRGFIKAYLIFGILIAIINFGPLFLPPSILIGSILIAYLLIFALIPVAIHGMMRYRLSRTSLRGIHMGYRGNLGEFYKKTSLDFFLTIITFGIYGSWLQINIRRYVMKHSRYGNTHAQFNASGGDLLLLTIVQVLLIAITFYIYIPWAIMRFFKFFTENSAMVQDEKAYKFKTTASGGQYLWVSIKAFLLTLVTLGICAPIGRLMIHKYLTETISLEGGFNFDSIEQTEEAYTDATGDDMMDILDFDF